MRRRSEREIEVERLVDRIADVAAESMAMTAFPAEMEQEGAEEKEFDFFDDIVDDEDIGDDTDEVLVQEREMLEELPLPGRSKMEADRKREWLKLPRAARAAIRRLHNRF